MKAEPKRVKLISFNGTQTPPEDLADNGNNYWLLVGTSGTVINETLPPGAIDDDRKLVQFDQNVRDLGLHCHNDIANTLWIKKADLKTLVSD